MNPTVRFIRDLALCAIVLLSLLGLYSIAAIYLDDPVAPSVQEGAYTDWGHK